jgi:hypothetical protein
VREIMSDFKIDEKKNLSHLPCWSLISCDCEEELTKIVKHFKREKRLVQKKI